MPHERTINVGDLSRYDRATVALWARSYAALSRRTDRRHLAEAAAHALLPRLREYTAPAALLARYETDAAADFALIGSLLPGSPSDEQLWQARDAAFHLRWRELIGGHR
ncbi:MAG: hypothetical protein AB7I38_18405 [Dehalococcoidia bacterium]